MQRVRLGVVRGYEADVMARGIWKIAMLAALVAALGAGPARAGTYDVTTCSPTGPGGVNHAWNYAVRRLDEKGLENREAAAYLVDTNCTDQNGLWIRTNPGFGEKSSWGVWADWEFTAPPNALVVGLKLWRYSRVWQTDNGDKAGRWDTHVWQDSLVELGGEI